MDRGDSLHFGWLAAGLFLTLCTSGFAPAQVCVGTTYGAAALDLVIKPGTPTCIAISAIRIEDKSIRLQLVGTDEDDANVIYARWGSPPTSHDYDILAADTFSASQTAWLHQPRADTLYVHVHNGRSTGTSSRAKFKADLIEHAVTRVVPEAVCNQGRITLAIHGTRLSGAVFELVLPATGFRIPGTLVSSDDGVVHVGFSVDEVTPGDYDLSVSDAAGAREFSIPGALLIEGSKRPARIAVRLSGAQIVRRGRLRRIHLGVRNTGNEIIDAPPLRLEGPVGTSTEFLVEGKFAQNSIEGPVEDPDAAPGTLPPSRDWIDFPIDFRANEVGEGEFRLVRVSDDELLARLKVRIVASVDPNTKDGPVGEGPGEVFIDGGEDLAYRVNFENLSGDNQAPVQELTIIDNLDDHIVLDDQLEQFRFGDILIGQNPPIDLSGPLVPCDDDSECWRVVRTLSVSVQTSGGGTEDIGIAIEGRVDFFERRITWTITHLEPLADDQGFLAPHEDPDSDEGLGSVSFIAQADKKSPECDEVRNKASIQFDDAPTIETNEVRNCITCPPPETSGQPSPPDEINTPRSVAHLGWTPGNRAESFDIYLWPEGEAIGQPIAQGLKTADFDLEKSLPAGIHHWKIDAQGKGGKSQGAAWSFLSSGGSPALLFVRGDANADGARDITDSISILNWLFLGGSKPPCADAADGDDDGAINITDAIYLLNWLFLGGSSPADPQPNCGFDPTLNDALDCAIFEPCD